MNRFHKIAVFSLLSSVLIYGISYCGDMDINSLVDSFQKATDLQKTKILSDNIGKDLSAGGIVSNAGEYDFFDTNEDIKGTYYQVTTEQQKTDNNTPYQVIFLFKDQDQASGIDKGEKLSRSGKIIKLTDERLQIAVWILCADLTDKDKALIK